MINYILKSMLCGLICLPALILISIAPWWAYIASIAYLCALYSFAHAHKERIKRFLKCED